MIKLKKYFLICILILFNNVNGSEETNANRAYTDQVTSLTGRKKVKIKTTDLNIKGAVIANTDENGDDQGNLDIETDNLTVENLNDSDKSKSND